MPATIAAVGLLLVLGAWVQYLASIPEERVAVRPRGTVTVQSLGVLLSACGTWLAWRGGTGWIGAAVLLAVGSGLMAFFIYLIRTAPLPDGDLQVAVGDQLPSFAASDVDGRTFRSEELEGQRVLLKFFRGSW